MLYHRTCSDPFRIRLPTSQAFLSLARKLFVSAPSERRLCLAPEATSASSASGLSVPHVTVYVLPFKKGWRHTRAHSSETEKSSFCSFLLLPPRVHITYCFFADFRLHHSTATCQNARPLAW